MRVEEGFDLVVSDQFGQDHDHGDMWVNACKLKDSNNIEAMTELDISSGSGESSDEEEQDKRILVDSKLAMARSSQNGKSVFSLSNGKILTSSSSSSIPIPLSSSEMMKNNITKNVLSPKHFWKGHQDGEPIKLPESLESLPKSDHFPSQRHRWNTNEEIASMLIAFDRHQDWLSKEVKIRPKSGSMLLYSRKKVRYRRDGYCWKKRKDGKTTREDHMKLKVQGMECIYGCYVHSAILPTFHRRCYWLLQNPDIVLVHYLNVPYPDDNKMVVASSVSLWSDKKEWTKEELISQLKPMFFSEEEPDLNNELEISTAETVEAIVTQLMEKQRAARAAALNKQLECGCPDSTNPEKSCGHTVSASNAITATSSGRGKVQATKSEAHTTSGGNNPGSMRAPSSRNGRGRHLMGMQHRVQNHEGGNHFYKTNDRYYPQGSSYPQVSSTTGNLDSRHSPAETPSPQHQINSAHHQPQHLVLSVSQVQTSRGLVILNSQGDPRPAEHHHQQQQLMHSAHNGLNPLMNQNNGHHALPTEQHLASSRGSRSADPMEAVAPNHSSSPVSSAVRSLNSLSDFHLDSHNGNFDSYTVTDTLLSEAGRDEDVNNGLKSHHGNAGAGYQPVTNIGSGPLLDFKSAFSDIEATKQGDLNFLHDTLDMNQDELHRSGMQNSAIGEAKHANNIHRAGQHPVDLNPMDFIEHDVVNPPASSVALSPPTSHPPSGQPVPFGEVNLDAFDMLNEFNDLNYPHGHAPPLLASNGPGPMLGSTSKALRNNNNGGEMVQITDYSPEWSYTEGGQKLLVIGPWFCTDSSYQILFDGIACTTTTLVQNGVLKCITPAHSAGIVRLEVAYDSYVISTAVNLEYKQLPAEQPQLQAGNGSCLSQLQPTTSNLTTLSKNNNNFILHQEVATNTSEEDKSCEKSCERLWKFTLMEKLDFIADQMFGAENHHSGMEKLENRETIESNVIEEVLVSVIEKIMRSSQKNKSNFTKFHQYLNSKDYEMKLTKMMGNVPDITILHLSASLGYTRLTCSLLHLMSENSSLPFSCEISTRTQDYEGFTPLMRACLNGHTSCALHLYRSDPAAYKILNYDGESCQELSAPHENLFSELQRLEKLRILGEASSSHKSYPKAAKTKSGGVEFLKPGIISRKPSRAASLDESQNKSWSNSSCLRSSSSSSCSSSKSSKPLACSSTFRSNRSASPNNFHQPLSVNIGDYPPAKGVVPCRHGLLLAKRSSFDSGINLFSSEKKDLKTIPKNSKQKAALNDIKMQDRQPNSPFIDVEGISDEDEQTSSKHSMMTNIPNNGSSSMYVVSPKRESESEEQKVLNLAEQFIAAMPDRIKNESDQLQQQQYQEEEPMLICTPAMPSAASLPPPFDASQSDDLGVESLCDDLDLDFDFNFEFDNHRQKSCSSYRDSPRSSLSADESSSCLQSPASYTLDSVSSPGGSCTFSVENGVSPPGTTADLQEFLQASLKCERDLSNLTLSDQEQRELYEAAQIIQKAYRSYKGRKKATSDHQEREAKAAVVIQNYYRRYKTYLYWKQMANAATLIQNKYRTYKEHKRFKKSQEAATCIQNYYRTYKEHQSKPRGSRESTPSNGLKRTYSQRRQHQAAKKIQQFMRKTHLKPISEVSLMRKGTADRTSGQNSGCFTCHPRKREAPASLNVPAKLQQTAAYAAAVAGENYAFSHHHSQLQQHQAAPIHHGHHHHPHYSGYLATNGGYYGWNGHPHLHHQQQHVQAAVVNK